MIGKIIDEYCVNINKDSFENSKLCDIHNISKEYKKIDFKSGNYEYVGPIVGNLKIHGKREMFSSIPSHALVIGGTGCGKSQCYYSTQIEAIARSKNKPSVFIMDLKGEFYRNFYSLYKENGYKIYTLNLKEPFKSDRYNPLTPAWTAYQNFVKAKKALEKNDGRRLTFDGKKFRSNKEWMIYVQNYKYIEFEKCESILRRIATLIIKVESKSDPFWERSSQNAFVNQAIGLLEDSEVSKRRMTKEKFNIANIIRVTKSADIHSKSLDNWISIHDKKSVVNNLYSFYPRDAKTTKDGLVATFMGKAGRWDNVSTEWVTSYSDIDIDDIVSKLGQERVVIFAITDESRSESYDLCMAFIDHLITALKNRSETVGVPNNDFHILADEFANMPPLANIQNRISTLRSYRVWLHMGIQSFEQLDDRYGEAVRNIILDNCNTQLIFGCNNFDTLRNFSASLGQKIATSTTYNINNLGEISVTVNPINCSLIKVSDLSALKLGEAYVKVFRLPVLHTQIDPYFMCDDLKHPETTYSNKSIVADLEKYRYDIRDLCKNGEPDFESLLRLLDD